MNSTGKGMVWIMSVWSRKTLEFCWIYSDAALGMEARALCVLGALGKCFTNRVPSPAWAGSAAGARIPLWAAGNSLTSRL